MMPVSCTARENWPRAPFRRGCPCPRCRGGVIDDLAERSLSVALAHAQNRAERAADQLADELTVDRDLSVTWSPRQNLQTWRNQPAARPGGTPPNRSGQWLYKLFLGSDTKPLYLGRVTGRNTSLVRRIDQHVGRGVPIPGLTPQGVVPLITANKQLLRARSPAAKSESRLLDDILASLGPQAFQISFSEVRRLASGGRRLPARAADTAMVEKRYHRKGAARINSPDNPRFEDEAERAARTELALAQAVRHAARDVELSSTVTRRMA